jgi:rod shape-determining protein MreD
MDYVMRSTYFRRRPAAASAALASDSNPTVRVVVAMFFCLLLQTLLVRIPKVGHYFQFVDFMLILTVFVGVQPHAIRASIIGMTGGLAQDFAYGALYGASGFPKTVIGFLLATVSVKFSLDSKPVRFLVLPLCSIVNSLLYVYFLYFFGLQSKATSFRDIVRVALVQLVANVLVAIPLFWLFDRTLGKWLAVRGSGQAIEPRAF